MSLKTSYQRANERYDANEFQQKNGHDRNGFQASDIIWNHSGQRSDGMRVRITGPAENSGTKAAITKWDWQQTLHISRQLSGRVGEISGCFRQKATYVIGDSWAPQFHGENQKWGRIAEDWLDYYFDVANVRGEPFDFITSLFVDCIAIDRDGDAAMLTILDEGEPRVQFIAAHRIGFRQSVGQDMNGCGKVPEGKHESFKKYVGMKCYNGVVFGNNGKVVAYGILGETAEDDRVFGIESCQLLYDPEWSDQGRGIPSIARASIVTAMDYEDIVHFVKRQVKQDSAQGLMHYNEEGSAPSPTGADFMAAKDAGAVNQDVLIEQLEGNEIMYFKALGGGKIEPYNSTRPHPNVDAHNMRLLRGLFQSSGWLYELYDPTQIGGAPTRLIQDGARASVNLRQRLSYKRWIRAISHGLSWAMEVGDVPPNNDNDWLKFWPTLPAKLTVDARYDDKTKLERIRVGGGTYAVLFGDEGKNWQDEIRQRVVEQKFIQDVCDEMKVDIDKVQLLTPNGNPPPAEDANQSQSDDKKAKK